ncbi:hypothetical protein RYX36_024217, partial [Vicia faba]
VIINNQVLPRFMNLLTNNKKSIKKDACWTLSNITTGNTQQIQVIINHQVLPHFMNLLANNKKKHQERSMLDVVEYHSQEYTTDSGLENTLNVGEADKNVSNADDVNLFSQMIDDAKGLEKIENLQSHDNTEIYEKAVKILENILQYDLLTLIYLRFKFNFSTAIISNGIQNTL